MTRVTFGVAASPIAAVQALQQTATYLGQDYSIASSHIKTSLYAVMSSISHELHKTTHIKSLAEEGNTQHQKALGNCWDSHKDLFFISVRKVSNLLYKMNTRLRYRQNIRRSWLVHSIYSFDENFITTTLGVETELG